MDELILGDLVKSSRSEYLAIFISHPRNARNIELRHLSRILVENEIIICPTVVLEKVN